MMYLISVELDSRLARRLLDDPVDWNYKDKNELMRAIQEAIDSDDVEEEEDD